MQQPEAAGQSLLVEHFAAHDLFPVAGSVTQTAVEAQHCEAHGVWPDGHMLPPLLDPLPPLLPELPLLLPEPLPLPDELPLLLEDEPASDPPPDEEDDEHAPAASSAATPMVK